VSIKIPSALGRTILELRAEELRLKREARNVGVGENVNTAVQDVAIAPDWIDQLREVSPLSRVHSYLMPYWYRAKARWVLYDVLPAEAIDDALDTGSGITGAELRAIMAGPRPSERVDAVPVSDTQHEMWRLWGGFARPFWVLEGETGGHQVHFSPAQSSALLRMGLEPQPPAIGSLPPCPFDNRVRAQLNHLNRLHQFADSIDRLRKSGSPEFAQAETERLEREVREAEMAFIETQMRPVVEMSMSLARGPNTRSEHADALVHVVPGMASRAKDAYEKYKETGDWDL
jgi:hypothetical protein